MRPIADRELLTVKVEYSLNDNTIKVVEGKRDGAKVVAPGTLTCFVDAARFSL